MSALHGQDLQIRASYYQDSRQSFPGFDLGSLRSLTTDWRVSQSLGNAEKPNRSFSRRRAYRLR